MIDMTQFAQSSAQVAPIPAYQVVPLKGSVMRETKTYEMEEGKPDRYGRPRFIGKGFVSENRPEPAGYMVYFAAGHSIRVRDVAELRRLKLDGAAPLIDPNTGEVVQLPPTVDLSKMNSAASMPELIHTDEED